MKLRAQLLAYALSFPESREDHPWGESVAKVKDKVFVFFGIAEPGIQLKLALKLPHSGVGLLDRGLGEPTGYGLGKSGWVTIELQRGDEASFAELCAWVEESWRAVAPKKLVKAREAGSAKATEALFKRTRRNPPHPSSAKASATTPSRSPRRKS